MPRISEALSVTFDRLFVPGGSSLGPLALVLGRTKRGLEQKVVISDANITLWVKRYLHMRGWQPPYARVLDTTYGRVARRLTK
eukprot:4329555-Lingulodinium_polyedra.AAC.1